LVSIVGTSTVNNATGYPFQRKSFYANGRFWVFYCNGSNIVYCTSTDGLTWSTPATIRACAYGHYFSVWFDGTYLHYVYVYGAPIYYRRGTPNSDGSITWSANEQSVSTTYNRVYYPMVSVDSDRYVWVGYIDSPNGVDYYPFVIKSGNNNGTWGTGTVTQLSTTAGGSVSVIPLTARKVLVLYSCGSTLKAKRWDGSTWGSEVATASTPRSGNYYSAVAQGDDVHLVFLKSSGYDILYTKYIYSNNSFSSERTLVSASSTSAPVISIDTSTNDLFVFAATKVTNWPTGWTADHIYYVKYTASSGTWSSWTDWIDESSTGTNELLSDSDKLTCFYQAYGNYIGLEYMTKTGSPYNVKFTSLVPVRGWLLGWFNRKSHVINSASGAGTLYQVKIKAHYGSGTDSGEDVYLNSHARSDFGDVRFANDAILLNYWMESKVDSDYAIFWVQVVGDLSSSSVTIYIYYGNNDATTTSNGTNTFPLFDDFLGSSLDTTKWAVYQVGDSYSVTNSMLILSHTEGYRWLRVQSLSSFGINYAFKMRYYQDDVSDYNKLRRLMWMTSTTAESPSKYMQNYHNDYHDRFWQAYNTAQESYDKGTDDTNWHLTEICRSSATFARCYQDGVNENNFTSQAWNDSALVGMQVGKSTWELYGSYNVYIDWVLVRKYVDPEPTHGSWGNEEILWIGSELVSLSDIYTWTAQKTNAELLTLTSTFLREIQYLRTIVDSLLLEDVFSFFKLTYQTCFETLSLLGTSSVHFFKTIIGGLGSLDVIRKQISKSVFDLLTPSDVIEKRISKLILTFLTLEEFYIPQSYKLVLELLFSLANIQKEERKEMLASLALNASLTKARLLQLTEALQLLEKWTRSFSHKCIESLKLLPTFSRLCSFILSLSASLTLQDKWELPRIPLIVFVRLVWKASYSGYLRWKEKYFAKVRRK